MSLTSYRAAPPRVGSCVIAGGGVPADLYVCWVDLKTWRRPTLPRLKTQYHGRWGFSRPSSGWDRVGGPRHGHQVIQSSVLLSQNAPVFAPLPGKRSPPVRRCEWQVLG